MLIVSGALAVARRDLRQALSYRVSFITIAVSELFSLLVFYYVSRLVAVEPFADPDDYFAFVVIGLVALQVANAVLFFPVSVIQQELVAGSFERLVVSPLGPVTGVVGMMIYPWVSAIITNSILLAFAVVVLGLELSGTAILALPAGLLVAMSFAPIGLAVVALAILVKRGSGLVGFAVAGLSLTAGLYFPVDLLPSWVSWTTDVQPLTPAVDLMRNLLTGAEGGGPPLTLIAKLAGSAAVGIPVALLLLSGAVRAARRRGTIVEY